MVAIVEPAAACFVPVATALTGAAFGGVRVGRRRPDAHLGAHLAPHPNARRAHDRLRIEELAVAPLAEGGADAVARERAELLQGSLVRPAHRSQAALTVRTHEGLVSLGKRFAPFRDVAKETTGGKEQRTVGRPRQQLQCRVFANLPSDRPMSCGGARGSGEAEHARDPFFRLY
eukprot:7379401-Prymnesium_polylepis.1